MRNIYHVSDSSTQGILLACRRPRENGMALSAASIDNVENIMRHLNARKQQCASSSPQRENQHCNHLGGSSYITRQLEKVVDRLKPHHLVEMVARACRNKCPLCEIANERSGVPYLEAISSGTKAAAAKSYSCNRRSKSCMQ